MHQCRFRLLGFVFVFVAAYLAFQFPSTFVAGPEEAIASPQNKSDALLKMKKLSVPFTANQGQVEKRIKFYARTFGGTVFVTDRGEMVYSLSKVEKERTRGARMPKSPQGWVLTEELVGGEVNEVKAEEKATTKVSHFIGNDSSQWRSNIPTYDRINLGEVYQGIEVKLRAYGSSMEKLFYVKPGSDPGKIRLRLRGSDSLKVNEEGELEVRTGLGVVKFSKPVAYQEKNGRRIEAAVNYDLRSSIPSTPNSELSTLNSETIYGFNLGDYDQSKELVIDPLLQSTYLGGSNSDEEYSVAIDFAGNIYVAGDTSSTSFPGTAGGAQTSYGGGSLGCLCLDT